MDTPMVIYDGSRELYRKMASKAESRIEAVFIDWYSDGVQRFLEIQFGSVAFSFMVIQDGKVYAGQYAVRKFLNLVQGSNIISEIGFSGYPIVSKPVGLIFHRRSPASLNGVYRLDEKAAQVIEEVRDDSNGFSN